MNGRTNSTSTADVGVIDIPLDPPTSFLCEARNSKVDITWVDPKDKYATPEGEQMEDTDQLVSVWAYTKIVRKEGSQPSSPSDGITVYTSDIRNQHQSAIYEDTGVTNGVTYYYAAYAYNTDGVYSDGAFSGGITPIEWSTVLNENSWEQINSACTQGVAQSLWEIGDEKNDSVDGILTTMVIIGFNHTPLADNSGNSAITFSNKGLIVMNTRADPDNFGDQSRYYSDIKNLYTKLSISLQSVLQNVYAYRCFRNRHATVRPNTDIGTIRLSTATQYSAKTFLFVSSEVTGEPYGSGNSQYSYYTSISNRVKKLENGTGIAGEYVLNESYDESGEAGRGHFIYYIDTSGNRKYTTFYMQETYASFGFCVGKSSV